ncbi:MAG: hypothetical protein GY797_08800 [Deltaproteobacteria bacterium]|nr:hypothetical protein [Deltaproteobacteria bacterium]
MWILKAVSVILIGVVLAGCSTPMALNSFTGKDSLNEKSMGLFTVRMSNEHFPEEQPELNTVYIKPSDSGPAQPFWVKHIAHQKVKKQFNEYLVSVSLQPGAYEFTRVWGASFGPRGIESGYARLTCDRFDFRAVSARFDLPQRSVVYLGHVNMNNRKRKRGETRSSPLLHNMSRFDAGTFDITITDRGETDIPLFREKYPNLKGIPIETSIMQREGSTKIDPKDAEKENIEE